MKITGARGRMWNVWRTMVLISRQSPLQAGDVVIVHSVSGRNTVPIDLALEAKNMGVKVIVITNLAYTELVTSRHSSGKKLKDCGDIVIDNCGEFEDSASPSPALRKRWVRPQRSQVPTSSMQWRWNVQFFFIKEASKFQSSTVPTFMVAMNTIMPCWESTKIVSIT